MNPKDPLFKAGPDRQRELFDRFAKEANGYSTEDAIGAALNILINAVRQAHSSRSKAHVSLDEKLAKAKELLDQHYDAQGRKRGLFPYHQVIEVAPFVNSNDFLRR